MKSNIRFVNRRDNKQKHDLWTLISERYRDNKVLLAPKSFIYLALLYSKYIIERENLNPTPIINGELDTLLPYLNEKFNDITKGFKVENHFKEYKFYELLKKIMYEDYELESYIDRVLDAYIEPNKKYLLVSSGVLPYIPYPNVDVVLNPPTDLALFYNNLFDEIIGIKKKYYKSDERVDLRKYDSIIYINDFNEYFEHNHFIKSTSINNKDIFMITKYNYISNPDISFLDIKSVMLDKDKAYLTINRNYPFTKNIRTKIRTKEEKIPEYKVNIKELSNIEDKDLKEIIKTDEEIENISIYINREDIMKNCRRIGFSSYVDFSKDKARILRLIDSNEHLTRRIRELDKDIEEQINKLIVR